MDMKSIKIIITALTALFFVWFTLYLRYENVRLLSENDDLKRDNKHLLEQVQKCNDEFERWNKSYMAQDYAKRNNIKPLNINE
jgi:hypothetical protein